MQLKTILTSGCLLLILVQTASHAQINPQAVDTTSLRQIAHLNCVYMYKLSASAAKKASELQQIRRTVNKEMWYPPFIRELRRRLRMAKYKSEAEMLDTYKKTLYIEIPACR